MQHSPRVGEGHGVADLAKDVEDLLERDRRGALELRERASANPLHRQIGRAVRGLAQVVYGHDVGVLQPRRDVCFSQEARTQTAACATQQLDGDLPLERVVYGRPHVGHAAPADDLTERVALFRAATDGRGRSGLIRAVPIDVGRPVITGHTVEHYTR